MIDMSTCQGCKHNVPGGIASDSCRGCRPTSGTPTNYEHQTVFVTTRIDATKAEGDAK